MSAVLEGLRANAAAFTAPDDDFEPVLFLETETGVKILGLRPYFANETKKELFAAVLPALIKKERPTRVALLVSAWAIEANKDYFQNDEPRPSSHPDRIELVLVTEVTKEGITDNVVAYIGRDPLGLKPPTLGEEQDSFAQAEVFTGRFIDPILATMKEIR